MSENKTGITNLKRKYSEFLGFKLKLREKSNKNVAKTKMCDKARLRAKEKLTSVERKRLREARKRYAVIRKNL